MIDTQSAGSNENRTFRFFNSYGWLYLLTLLKNRNFQVCVTKHNRSRSIINKGSMFQKDALWAVNIYISFFLSQAFGGGGMAPMPPPPGYAPERNLTNHDPPTQPDRPQPERHTPTPIPDYPQQGSNQKHTVIQRHLLDVLNLIKFYTQSNPNNKYIQYTTHKYIY